MSGTKLVIGASGFLGSHVTRQLVERGEDVRILVRPTSSRKALGDIDIDRRHGDVFDDDTLREAMSGVDDVFYCVVDPRAWLRDPAPLFRTNVEGLRHVLDAAVDADLRRFVFTSTIGTIGSRTDRPASEDDPFDGYDDAGPYVQSRIEAEKLVLDYHTNRGLPAVAMCVANTYGPGDWQPTTHGSYVAAAAAGRMPVYVKDLAMEVVGVEDAAAALILAADHARDGERYIVSERFMDSREMFELAAEAVGVKPPRFGIPYKLMYAMGFGVDVAAKVLRRDFVLTSSSVRLMKTLSRMDHGKAMRELSWQPRPIEDSLRKAAQFYRDHGIG